jgi:hypothetical protein
LNEKKPFTDAPTPLVDEAVYERTGKKVPEAAFATLKFADVVAKPEVVAVVAVPVRLPVMIPLFMVTPEIAVADATYKLPPIPTPPVTTNAPDDGLVEAVEPDTLAVDVLTVVAANVESETVFDDGLNVSPESEETATPLPPFTGENKT